MNRKFKLLIFEFIVFLFLVTLVSSKEVEIENKYPTDVDSFSNDYLTRIEINFDFLLPNLSTITNNLDVCFYFKPLSNLIDGNEQFIIYEIFSNLISFPRDDPPIL